MEKLDSLHERSWATVLEGVIAGVSHQISNRVAVLAGVADIVARDESIPPILRALVDEVPRLEEGVRLLGLLGRESSEVAEPLEVQRLVQDAVSLATLHPDVKETVTVSLGDVPPVMAEPSRLLWELVRAIVDEASRGLEIRATVEAERVGVKIGARIVWATSLSNERVTESYRESSAPWSRPS